MNSTYQQFAASALVGHCRDIIRTGAVDEAKLQFLIDQMTSAFALPTPKTSGIVVKPYLDPTYFSGRGFHACDDDGNHGFGATREAALKSYRRAKGLQVGDHDPDYDRALNAIAAEMGLPR